MHPSVWALPMIVGLVLTTTPVIKDTNEIELVRMLCELSERDLIPETCSMDKYLDELFEAYGIMNKTLTLEASTLGLKGYRHLHVHYSGYIRTHDSLVVILEDNRVKMEASIGFKDLIIEGSIPQLDSGNPSFYKILNNSFRIVSVAKFHNNATAVTSTGDVGDISHWEEIRVESLDHVKMTSSSGVIRDVSQSFGRIIPSLNLHFATSDFLNEMNAKGSFIDALEEIIMTITVKGLYKYILGHGHYDWTNK